MASLVFYFSATVLFAQSTAAFNCSAMPIYVDIHKRAVHDSPVFQYGSFIGLGTPAQNQSLWPSLAQNHTSVTSPDYCKGNSTLQNCTVSTGGFYDNQESTTFVASNDFKTLDVSGDAFTGFFGQETLRLYTHYFETDGASQTVVANSTIEVAEQGSITPSRVGVGSSSTLLRDLAGQGMIAGRTYSLYIGQGFDRAGGVVNGSNVFGGYDAGRFTGVPNKYPMNIANVNPMSVRIKDIVITDSKDNTNVSLFDNTVFTNMSSRPNDFEAQITTEQFPISLPYQITQNLIGHLGAVQDNTWGDKSLKLQNTFNGTLSIVLEDGFTVTLPPEVLMNVSNITPIQDSDENSDTFYLGTAFLGQVYLMADFDSEDFFLAPAVQKNNMVMPQTFCPKATPVAYVQPQVSSFQRQGLVGAVVGGVIGSIAILAALYCCFITWMRKKDERKLKRELQNNQKQKMMEQMDVEEAPVFDPPPKNAAKAIFGRRNKGWMN